MSLLSADGSAVRRPALAERPAGSLLGAARPARPASRIQPRRLPSACPEIDCIRHLLPQPIIAAAEQRARQIGLGAERVLICADAITEDGYLAALARSLGTKYQPLDRTPRSDCPLSDDELIRAAAAGLMPLYCDGRLTWVIAPRNLTARRLADPQLRPPKWLQPFRLTSSGQLQRFVTRHTQRALGARATNGLRQARPLFSNAPRKKGWRSALAFAVIVLAGICLAVKPAMTIGLLGTALCVAFLGTAALRLWSTLAAKAPAKRLRDIDDRTLPTYTIICALYREAAVVEKLVAAISTLDYPPEKLDVKFVIEADDDETRDALDDLRLGLPFEIITAPPFGPRTKPKALNVALPLARGSYTVIYDAEDTPEPDQLRRAIAAFRSGGNRLACVQAALTIDNTTDGLLTRMFTASYAGQFDVVLPALATMHLPLPLGGSSNHFRTAALRKAGGWDPYNVTEDADLGVRLSRLGYRSAVLPSATYEEAPARFPSWLRQRTRWYKGWMQTWLVHMRQPRRLLKDLGLGGALAFQLLLAGNVLSALVHPFFTAAFCYLLVVKSPLEAIQDMDGALPIYAATLLGGYASTVIPDCIGLARRSLLRHAWILALTPIYWLLLSWAAWRALFQLLSDPMRWEKTEHGLAKNSRLFGTRFEEMSRRVRFERRRRPVTEPLAPTAIITAPRGAMLKFTGNPPHPASGTQ